MSKIEQIAIHVDMVSTERMRKHAMTGPEGDHDLPFQIFRYLSGYDEALERIAELKEKLEIKTAVIERWENEFDHMASQEFCEEIESISEGGADD